jgi:hypothetical protein
MTEKNLATKRLLLFLMVQKKEEKQLLSRGQKARVGRQLETNTHKIDLGDASRIKNIITSHCSLS